MKHILTAIIVLLLASAIAGLSGCATATAPADGIPEPLPIEMYAD